MVRSSVTDSKDAIVYTKICEKPKADNRWYLRRILRRVHHGNQSLPMALTEYIT